MINMIMFLNYLRNCFLSIPSNLMSILSSSSTLLGSYKYFACLAMINNADLRIFQSCDKIQFARSLDEIASIPFT